MSSLNCLQKTRISRFNKTILAMVLSVFGLVGFSIQADAQNAQDNNLQSPPQLRDQYLARYPFAKEQQRNDVTEGQQSSNGGVQMNMAYVAVTRACHEDLPPNPPPGTCKHYHQDTVMISTAPIPTARDREAVNQNRAGWIHCYGYPVSDTQFQIIDRANRQRLLELFFDPERWQWTRTMKDQMASAAASNSLAAAAESNYGTAFQCITKSLINVANESAAGNNGDGRVVYMVQQLFKTVFLPIAILLVLPGALITQAKCMINGGFLGEQEDASNPLEGILRAMIAILLIPATQLIVSYSIDVGNSMTDAVANPSRGWIQEDRIMNWAREQTYNPDNSHNQVGNQSSNQQGKSQANGEGEVRQENQAYLSQMMSMGFNSAAYMFSTALTMLTAYQFVFFCYLFLMGPIAACFFAWPGGVGSLFKNVFSNWLNAVVVLALWRFYWCVILACMTQRLVHVNPDPHSPFEMMVFNCFLALLLFVPFQPFNFNPGEVAGQILDKASQASGGGGAGGGGAPGAGGGGGGAKGGATPSASGQNGSGSGSGSDSDSQSKSKSGSSSSSGGGDSQDSGGSNGQGSGSSSGSGSGSSSGSGATGDTGPPPTSSGTSPPPSQDATSSTDTSTNQTVNDSGSDSQGEGQVPPNSLSSGRASPTSASLHERLLGSSNGSMQAPGPKGRDPGSNSRPTNFSPPPMMNSE